MKTLAKIINNKVENLLLYSDDFKEKEGLIEVGDLDVRIGDEYINGKFYRNENEVMSLLAAAQERIEALENSEEKEALKILLEGIE